MGVTSKAIYELVISSNGSNLPISSNMGLLIFLLNWKNLIFLTLKLNRSNFVLSRLWWVVSVVSSVAWCMMSILMILSRWHHRPVIVSFDDKTTPIATIPFPAVTVCTTQKFTHDKVDTKFYNDLLSEITTNKTVFEHLSPETVNRFDAVQHVCNKDLKNLIDGLVVPITESVYNTIEEIEPGRSSIIQFSTFIGQLTFFKKIFTGEGVCYTFNSLDSREIFTNDVTPELITVNEINSGWNIESGYDSNVDESKVYPKRVFGSGMRYMLAFILGISIDDPNQYCNDFSHGFRISLHTPDEFPRLPDEFIFIPVDQDIYISVKPNVITTSKGLRNYSPKDRGCYFKSERKLRFFNAYGQQNCDIECAANFTLASCGCVKFSMPRINTTKVCTIADNPCYFNADDEFSKNLIVKKCNCLPDCTSITYDTEISQAQNLHSAEEIALKAALNESTNNYNSRVLISFKENDFISINRKEAYTLADFVASCGGLLGLFLGVSLLSIVEFIYYFTLRLCCRISQHKPVKVKASTWKKRSNLELLKNQLERRRFY
ncbi:pickpocket protein 28-like [Contarinia nasturtii]|uniref:pickpocket protein 28-like n=1 Tax=Contarinia nasturtii TaxID=265458 RepID=UPI0012D48938|nr:pickpocket protein 28-like [Contarinia nasturtii]